MTLQDIVVHNCRRALARIGLGHLAPSPEVIWPYVKRVTPSLERQPAPTWRKSSTVTTVGLLTKWDHYHGIYDRHLARFRGTALTLSSIYSCARSPKNFKAALDGLLAGMKGETGCP